MKKLLTILTFLWTTVSFSQDFDEVEYFYSVKNDNDSTVKYFMSFLNKFDRQDPYKNIFCEKASERVGDYYKFKHNYLKAIAYYDSSDMKYRNKLQFCGNGYYIDYIPRQYKISQCYTELNNYSKAVSTLTPYIFDHLGQEYFDSAMTSFYLQVLGRQYPGQQIQNQLKAAIDSIRYITFYRSTGDNRKKYLNVSCKIKLFQAEIELAGFETEVERDEVPFDVTKEYFVRRLKELNIYKTIQD